MDKCNDCGDELTKENTGKGSRRDVCNSCWDNRMWLVNNAPRANPEVFRKIQKAMGYGRGTAKKVHTFRALTVQERCGIQVNEYCIHVYITYIHCMYSVHTCIWHVYIYHVQGIYMIHACI